MEEPLGRHRRHEAVGMALEQRALVGGVVARALGGLPAAAALRERGVAEQEVGPARGGAGVRVAHDRADDRPRLLVAVEQRRRPLRQRERVVLAERDHGRGARERAGGVRLRDRPGARQVHDAMGGEPRDLRRRLAGRLGGEGDEHELDPLRHRLRREAAQGGGDGRPARARGQHDRERGRGHATRPTVPPSRSARSAATASATARRPSSRSAGGGAPSRTAASTAAHSAA